MRENKRIEDAIAQFLVEKYFRVVEVGVGSNPHVAQQLAKRGVKVLCTDIRHVPPIRGVECVVDDVFNPLPALYTGTGLIYSIRPGIEMIPPLIDLAVSINADLVVYHLGNEIYQNGGDIIDCGVILHRYVTASEPIEQG